jgi:hypothetical protein
MKKLILSVGLIALSFNVFAQTGGLGGSSSIFPSQSDSSQSGYGGALGGASTNTATQSNVPGNPNNTTTLPQNPSMGSGTLEQQRMEDPALRGGSLGGSTPATSYPTNQLPAGTGTTTEPATNVPSATGVGRGSPSGF